jgi:hypothetical protein
MHGLVEGLFQILLEVLAWFFGEQARQKGCVWALVWFLIVAAIAWILFAALV